MKQQAIILYEKMVDFKRFAVVLLAVGVIFYLGVIIPAIAKNDLSLYIMMLASISFFAASIIFFIRSKSCQKKLIEIENESNQS